MFQPYTTDTTPNGMRIARNAMRQRLLSMPLNQAHEWLCHPGEPCEDGCDAQPIPARLALYESDVET